MNGTKLYRTVQRHQRRKSARRTEGQTGEKDLADYHTAVRDKKKELIVNAFKAGSGSYTKAAAILGVHRNYLHRLVNNLGLRAHIREAAS